jgi:hypothetical protein
MSIRANTNTQTTPTASSDRLRRVLETGLVSSQTELSTAVKKHRDGTVELSNQEWEHLKRTIAKNGVRLPMLIDTDGDDDDEEEPPGETPFQTALELMLRPSAPEPTSPIASTNTSDLGPMSRMELQFFLKGSLDIRHVHEYVSMAFNQQFLTVSKQIRRYELFDCDTNCSSASFSVDVLRSTLPCTRVRFSWKIPRQLGQEFLDAGLFGSDIPGASTLGGIENAFQISGIKLATWDYHSQNMWAESLEDERYSSLRMVTYEDVFTDHGYNWWTTTFRHQRWIRIRNQDGGIRGGEAGYSGNTLDGSSGGEAGYSGNALGGSRGGEAGYPGNPVDGDNRSDSDEE